MCVYKAEASVSSSAGSKSVRRGDIDVGVYV